MGNSLRPYAFFYILRIFPHSTPCMQLSSHTAFHRSIAPTKGHSSVPVTGTSSVRPSLFSTDSATYFLRLLILSNSIPFLVPITLSVHISLGACYGSGSCFDGLSHTGDYLTILPTHIAVRTEILYFTGSSVRWERTYSPWIFYRPRHIRQLRELPFCRLYRASDPSAFAYIRQSEIRVNLTVY